jgi:serine protease Do
MKRFAMMLCLASIALTGCLTAEDKAAKQAFDNRPQLGVTFEPEWYSENTVLVRDIPAGSAGDKAGLKPMDQITSFNGVRVSTIKSLDNLEMASQHGDMVKLGIIRNTHPMTVTAELQ